MNTKNKKPRSVPGTTKTLHNIEGVHIGSVTEYTDGKFFAYFAPLLHGEFKASRAEAEEFIVETFGEDAENLAAWKAAV